MTVTMPPSPCENNKGNNRKSRALNALLSASALGVFLEGCGGEPSGGGNGGGGASPPTPPTPVQVTGTTSYLATASAEAFTGDEEVNTVSYANADGGVTADLQAPANNRGSFAQRDTYENIENIVGSSQADTLTGNSQDNSLDGGEGADTLQGGEGADTIDGGEGKDYAVYSDSEKGVMVDLSRTTAQRDFDDLYGFTANDNEAEGDILSGIENIIGSNFPDWLIGDDNDNELQGGEGNDRLDGGEGADTLQGGAGDDDMIGGGGDDLILGELGNDRLYGRLGKDILRGDAGDDTLDGDGGDDELYGGGDDDIFVGDLGADIMDGGEGTDTIMFKYVNPGVRVSLALTTAQQDFDGTHGFAANQNNAVGDTISNIENIIGSP